MSNILGICGSPIRGGSTEVLIREILRGAESNGAKSDYIFLNDLDIMPCQACGQTPEEGYCFFNDGMDEIYKKFDWCDAIVVGSPIYFDSVSAQTKLFIDRTNCFRSLDIEGPEHFVSRITKKRKGTMVLVGGEREEYEHARRVIGGFFVWAGIESVGLIKFAHGSFQKGAAADDQKILKQAFDLAKKLISE
jgi:multimeric flavodoxin WrbA